MDSDFFFLIGKGLKSNDSFAFQGPGIKSKGKLHASFRCFWCKDKLRGNYFPINQQEFAIFLIHEGAGQFVFLPRNQTLVGNGIYNRQFLLSRRHLASGFRAGGFCANLREIDGLRFGFDISMNRKFLPLVRKRFKSNNRFTFQCACVEREG